LNNKKRLDSNIILKSGIFTILIAAVLTLVSYEKNLTTLSNKLFISAVALFIVGSISVLSSTSSWHYYRYVKDKKKGKKDVEEEYNEGIIRRAKQTRIGLSIMLGSTIPFLVTFIVAYIDIR